LSVLNKENDDDDDVPVLRNDQWYLWQYVACMRLSTVGDRTFPVAAAQTRNSLVGDVIKFPANLQNQTKISFILVSFP